MAQYIWSRVKRLYFPFLAWSLIYLLARDLKRVRMQHPPLPPVELKIGLLWKGIEYHLWFLPFLLFFSILLAVVYWALLKHDRRWRWVLIALAVAGGFAVALGRMPASWNQEFDNPTYAYVQYWRATPAALWGLAFAWFMTMGPVVYAVPLFMGMAGIVLTVICSLKQAINEIQLIPRALTGLGCILAALAPWRGPSLLFLAELGKNSYGVYLCHVLIVEFTRAIAAKAHLPINARLDLIMFVISFALSLAVVRVLAISPKTAWLNG